jgi:ERCC4-type nuclease
MVVYSMIVVDTREKFIDRIKTIIINLEDAPQFTFKALDKGDYDIINGEHQLRIERKSISDFCGSFRVLKSRLHTMRLQNQHTALLLEGCYSVQGNMIWVQEGCHQQPRMDYTSFSNFITHQASLGTWIFHTMGFEESVRRIIAIHNYLPRLDTPAPVLKCGSASELFIQLPGVGKTTIKDLRNKYESPLDAFSGLPNKAKEALKSW